MDKNKNIKILIVEDDFLVREEVSRVLKNIGYEIIGIASNGLKAIEMTKSLKPDILIMDIKMHEIDGLEACRKIQQSCPTPVIILTAYNSRSLPYKASCSGASGYLLKPPKAVELENAITIAIARHADIQRLTMEIAKCKQTEKALRKAEEKFRTIANYTFDWEYWISPEGKLIYISPSCERITGYKPEEFYNNPKLLADIVHPDDTAIVENHKCKALKTGINEPIEFRIISKNNEKRWISHVCQTVYNNEGVNTGIRGSNRDVTDQKNDELVLLEIQKLNSVSSLAGGIAYDFNNILTGVFGNISIAKEQLTEKHPSIKYLEDAEISMNRTIHLTKRLFDYAKSSIPVREDVNIDVIIKEVVRFNLFGSNVTPIFEHTNNLWTAKVDKGQMQQIFSILTINAHQAMPDGGNLYITLDTADIRGNLIPNLKKGKYIKITVRDEGVGIDKKHLERIFDPYFRTKHINGGFGLATTFSIVNKHNGHINIDSELGKGTTLTLYLPASGSKQTFMEQSNNIRPARVLVMDDNEAILKVTTIMLKRSGYSVDVAYDGKQAVKIYKQAFNNNNKFDVVIMDLVIPNGIGGKRSR